MAKEIERKYIVIKDGFKELSTAKHSIVQGYISTIPDRTVRVRIKDSKAFLTVKGRNQGAERSEWEFEIPFEEAKEILYQLPGVKGLTKTRYIVPWEGHIWEVDEFHGQHKGLVLAEIELSDASEEFDLPPFVGKEVTDNPEYYNSVLASSEL